MDLSLQPRQEGGKETKKETKVPKRRYFIEFVVQAPPVIPYLDIVLFYIR
jgi:hypothetical protein